MQNTGDLSFTTVQQPDLDYARGNADREGASPYLESRAKRVLDVVLVILGLPLVVPVIVALWLLVRRDGGVGVFGHPRVGRNGQTFTCWKIRTMVPEAEEVLAAYLSQHPDARKEWESDFKLQNDPRITRLGSVLRKTGLDELPQLWNVMRGEMSLVGPRPVVTAELEKYGQQRWVYCAARPGLTGLWQVTGRGGAVTYAHRIRMDRNYISRASIWQDLWLIAGTVKTVIFAQGR